MHEFLQIPKGICDLWKLQHSRWWKVPVQPGCLDRLSEEGIKKLQATHPPMCSHWLALQRVQRHPEGKGQVVMIWMTQMDTYCGMSSVLEVPRAVMLLVSRRQLAVPGYQLVQSKTQSLTGSREDKIFRFQKLDFRQDGGLSWLSHSSCYKHREILEWIEWKMKMFVNVVL